MTHEDRAKALGIDIPALPQPGGNYTHAVQIGSILFLAGRVPRSADGTRLIGKIGSDVTVEEGREHARFVGRLMLAALRDSLGSLNRVKRIAKLTVMINAEPDFGEHARVADGCSDLMMEVFADAGRHARTAVGVSSLPSGMTMEIEGIIEVAE